ncbi:uncharacterized protein [Cicer arietinum]|uniref:Uncharacterized protein LOC101497185 n=1 Tax=Cicer arietinum TaxID=3827 RepID=A0A1S2XYA7_CICAR|nr:uncharacterized protein LOC101497185 [Cicer arietinum]XP_004496387.1 uncharacterized protein LOC101497515 [Cicer arietinum]
MSGGRRNNDNDSNEGEEGGGGGGWASTFFKVAGAAAATAAVAGGLYMSLLKQADADVAAVRVHADEEVILNVDGSLLRQIPSAGCGGVLTDSSGKWLCGFAQKLNPNLREDETEKEAILRGLIWVKEKGKRKVTAKTDNEGIEISVNSGRRSNDPLICRIREVLNSPHWQASLIWTPGDTNAVADKLAHKAHSLTSFDLHHFDYPPQNCATHFLI